MSPPTEQQQAPRLPPAALIGELSVAFMRTQALYTAAKLGVADALAGAGGPLPAAELAAQLGAKEDYLRRVLRFLAALGIFEEHSPGGVFANNEASELLRNGSGSDGGQPSQLDMVLHMGDESFWAFTKMYDAVLSSNPGNAFTQASGGLDLWQWLDQPENAEAGARFNRAMSGFSKGSIPAILQEYDWSQHAGKTLADIGGGVGSLLGAVLQQQPSMQGVLFDRPAVIEEAQELLPREQPDLAPRIQLAAGDFFESVPAADVYFMKHILHDWDDEACTKILQTLRRSAGPDARLLLCEAALPDGEPLDMRTGCMDLQMMVMVGGKERTVSEWRQLLAAGGFKLDQVLPLSTGMSMIEAHPS